MQHVLLITLCLLLPSFTSCASAASPGRVFAKDIDPERELLITHPKVVDSQAAQYPGAWSFGGLMEELYGTAKAPEVTRQWLEMFRVEQSAEGSGLPIRLGIDEKVIQPWQMKDGYDSASEEPWRPNLANAPFRLLAIVNRIDLAAPQLAVVERPVADAALERPRKLRGFGGYFGPPGTLDSRTPPSTFGEGRLIFGATRPDGQPLEGGWTLIFEYGLPAGNGVEPEKRAKGPIDDNHTQARRWASAWHQLSRLELGTDQFNTALEATTRQFTHASENPNRESFFARLRSSEAVFGPGREFRQFAKGERGFEVARLPMTPAQNFHAGNEEDRKALAKFLRSIERDIRDGSHSLPEKFDGGKWILADRALIPEGDANFHWATVPPITPNARRLFSMNTCNGCHAGETGCAEGMHVAPRVAGERAKVSDFLRTDSKPNRFPDPGAKNSLIQQREMEDRAAILAALLEPKEGRRLEAITDTLAARLRRGH